MYPIKQNMYTFKSYIRNRTRQELLIVYDCLVDECMTLCSRYLHSMETKFNRPHRYYENQMETEEASYIPHHVHAFNRALGESAT